MLIRKKWQLVLSLFVLAGLFFKFNLYCPASHLRSRQQEEFDLPYHNDDDFRTKIPFPVNVNKGLYDVSCQCSSCNVQGHPELEVLDWDSSRVLRGAPTERFRDNLLNDTRYLTTLAAAGFTNQFMTYVNLIYLASISGRVPIIPPFVPGWHISPRAGALPFSRIFNLTLLRKDLGRPILEWSDVKYNPSPTSVESPPNSEWEELGCWSTRPEADPQPLRVYPLLNNLRLDVSYTRVPTSTRHSPKNANDDFIIFSKLVPYIFSHSPLRGHFDFMTPSPRGHRLPPDEQLSCFDHLYFLTSSDRLFEWEASWSPAWNLIGTHVRFNNELIEIAKGYLSRAFHLSGAEIPPFIAIHDRRGDFAEQCGEMACLNPLSTFAEKVDEIRASLLRKHNMTVTQVFLASNEEDPSYWSEARAYGWVYFNHTEEKTLEKLGEWFLPIVDIVSQSLASGFVGTEHSTFSLLSSRRVNDWNDGSTILIPRL